MRRIFVFLALSEEQAMQAINSMGAVPCGLLLSPFIYPVSGSHKSTHYSVTGLPEERGVQKEGYAKGAAALEQSE